MKGIAIPIGGIIMVSISIVALYLLSFASWSETTYVTYRGELLMSASHEVELIRKMVDQGVYYISQRAAYELGNEERVWTSASEIKQELKRKIEHMLPSGENEGSYPEREIKWIEKDIEITFPSECNTNHFHVGGFEKFTLTDNKINTKITSTVPFNQCIDSSFFELVSTAEEIVDNTEYTWSETDLENKYGYKFEKVGNVIEIIDDTCENQNIKYCLVPLRDGNFDNLRFKFTV
ncbi:MAG: hypothetical protein ACE5J4_03330 [Candidatus Aenigmatarchaeota archaeon]